MDGRTDLRDAVITILLAVILLTTACGAGSVPSTTAPGATGPAATLPLASQPPATTSPGATASRGTDLGCHAGAENHTTPTTTPAPTTAPEPTASPAPRSPTPTTKPEPSPSPKPQGGMVILRVGHRDMSPTCPPPTSTSS